MLRDCKKRLTNLSMAYIDYRKVYDLVPHSWITNCLTMFRISENVIQFLQRSMKQWRMSLTSNWEGTGEVSVKRGMFQGDSLSPLLFVLCMVLMWYVFYIKKSKSKLWMKKKEYRGKPFTVYGLPEAIRKQWASA